MLSVESSCGAAIEKVERNYKADYCTRCFFFFVVFVSFVLIFLMLKKRLVAKSLISRCVLRSKFLNLNSRKAFFFLLTFAFLFSCDFFVRFFLLI